VATTTEGTAISAPPGRARSRSWLRYGIPIAALIFLVGVLAGLKFCQVSKLMAFGEKMQQAGPPPETVSSATAETSSWDLTLDAVGTVTGVERVTVSNEVPGMVTKIHFESGEVVQRGRVLVELDASTERAQLAAARARAELAEIEAGRSRKLVATSAVPREELDRAEAQLATANGEVATLEAQIELKTVRAPFNGKLGIRAVDLGKYLGPGSTITTLESVEGLYVDFSLPQEVLSRLRVGFPVRIELQGTDERVDGKITAIDPTLDAATRSVKLRASVTDGKHLRSGMFVRVSVVMPKREQVIVLPATAIVHAAYGDSVFIIEPKLPGSPGIAALPDGQIVKVARQQFVRLGPARGDFVAITKGIAPHTTVVSAGAFKLRNGSPVVIDNSRAPKPELAPNPPNR
jgi:membrane fusion protein (multidrug efflux system)